jgi:hypothetical protein
MPFICVKWGFRGTFETIFELILISVKKKIGGTTGTCCLAFNYEAQFVVTVLQIRWLNRGDVATLSHCHFESTWTNYFPSVADRLCPKFEMINSRGTYVCKLSNKCDLIALAINQKHVHKTCLTFMSPINGAIFQVNLRNFGLSEDAKGRFVFY